MKPDLHTHTTSSDGLLTPAELVALADKHRVTLLAVTDHDTFDGAAQLLGKPTPMPILQGVELSLRDMSGLHLLGYGRGMDTPLHRKVRALSQLRLGRARQMVEKLNALGYPLDYDEIAREAKGSVGRPHIARAMVSHGYVADTREAFDRFLADGAPAYVAGERLSMAEALPLMRESGFVPVLAHPMELEKTGAPGETMISVEDLYVRDNRGLVAVNGVSLQARAGEVLGIAAIEGNGQSELLEAITGMRPAISGKITVRGQDSTGLSPGQIRALGLAHVPEDRLATGVDPLADVSDNLLAGRQRDKEFNALGFHLRRSTIERYVSGIYEKFDIRGAGLHGKVGSMSGGNMQKVVVAREFSHDTPVLVISNPSRGIDIGAIEFIHTAIIDKRNEGCAVLLSSADLDEIFRLSDRIITMYEGEITGEFRADEITKEEIGYYMTGSRRKEAEEAHETTH